MKKRNTIFAVTSLLVVAVALLFNPAAYSYLPEFATKTVVAHWTSAPTWRINPSTNSNIVLSGSNVTSVITSSFAAWKAAPNVSGVVSGVTQGSTTTVAAHNNSDGINLICFVCSSNDFGSGGDTLAITYTSYNSSTGQIMDADLLFNPADTFTDSGSSCPSGATCGDLQTIATHEIGHFLGLDHSAVTSAAMYPFAPDLEHNLSSDDVAGISKSYPSSAPTVQIGSISGTISNSSGAGICGAHVFADSNTAAASYPSPIRKSPIATMTNSDGTYTITGLPADSYTVTAEPLDGPVDHTNIDTYTSTICGSSTLPTNFTTRQH